MIRTDPPKFVCRKAGFVVCDWRGHAIVAGSSSPFVTFALHAQRDDDDCMPLWICHLDEEETMLDAGRFSHFQDEMLPAEITVKLETASDGMKYISHANEMERPWSIRAFRNHAYIYLTFSFQDVPRVIEFKLRAF